LESYYIAFVAGTVGAFFMDMAEFKLARVGYSSGVTADYIGRWVYGLFKARWVHRDIRKTEPVHGEVQIGMAFHFIVGGGVVALLYPWFINFVELETLSEHLVTGIVYGLATSLLPWFILMPALGWGWFGSKTPFESEPVITPLLSHIAYGLGIGFTFVLYEVIIL